MKKIVFSLLVAAAAVLAGCVVTSVFPFYFEKDVVFDPAALGDWAEAGATNAPTEFVRVERAGGKSYWVTAFTTSETNRSDAHLFQLKQQLFLDVCPTNRSLDYVPVHQLSKVIRIEPTMETAHLNYDWLARLLEKNPKETKHLVLRERPAYEKSSRIVLTADTRELQRFIVRHMNNTNAWEEPSQWQRRK